MRTYYVPPHPESRFVAKRAVKNNKKLVWLGKNCFSILNFYFSVERRLVIKWKGNVSAFSISRPNLSAGMSV